MLCEGTGIDENSIPTSRSFSIFPAPGGFWITGHSGPVQIYDPAGRIVLSKEIKGKTLISPLRPGVYFVVVGRQRAKIAVR